MGGRGAQMETPPTTQAVLIARTEKGMLQTVTKACQDRKLFVDLGDYKANLRREVELGLDPEAWIR